MAELKIYGKIKVKKLKELFKEEFQGTLRVYNGSKLADDNDTLASIRENDGVKDGTFVCRASRTVGKFVEGMWNTFGIKVKIASPDNWVLALDGITLSKLKDIPNNAKKSDMEALIAYKRDEKAVTDVNDETEELEAFPEDTRARAEQLIGLQTFDIDFDTLIKVESVNRHSC